QGGALTASVVVAALVIGAAVATWQAVVATRAMAAVVVEKQRADKQAAMATSISESLQQLVGSLDGDSTKPADYTARQLLDDFADDLEKKLVAQPEVAADLHAIIGRGYAGLGQREKARKHLKRTLELRRSLFGDQHERYADALVDRSRPDACSGGSELAAQEGDLRQALAIYRAR